MHACRIIKKEDFIKLLNERSLHNKTGMAICFGFKWNIPLSQGITRVVFFRTDLLCLHLDNSELRLALSPTREHANTHINSKIPVMKIEKVVLRNEWRGIRLLSPRQFVSIFTPRPLWLTWATMCTYRVQTFNFFKTGTISIILSAFENWKFKQSLITMIARWKTWQDFPLKRKLYFHSDLPSTHCTTCWKWSSYEHRVCPSVRPFFCRQFTNVGS